jgi:hypothetical protein
MILAACCIGLASAPALAQSSPLSDDELSVQAEDPLAPLRTFQLYDLFEATLHDHEGSTNQLEFRAVLPFRIGELSNLFRITQDDTTASYDKKTGTSDPELIYLGGLTPSWGRWGLGFVLEPPTGGEELTSYKWSLGPSAGFVNTSSAAQQWGLFLRSYWSIQGRSSAKDVGIVNLQPLYTLSLGGGRSLSLGDSQLEYDTAESKWKSLQFGIKFGQVFRAWGQKWKPTAEVDYDFCRTRGNAMWTYRIGIIALVPGL